MVTILMLVLTKGPIERMAKQVFDSNLLPKYKFPPGSELRDSKATLIGERVYKILINAMSVSVLYSIMLRDDCDFLDVRMGGSYSHPFYFKGFPCQ